MSNEDLNGELLLPALRAHIGDWIYYVTFLNMEEIAARIRIAEEIHSSKPLNELIQRELTERAYKISDYLLHQKQRFFNALVVGVYGGAPQWYELAVRENRLLDPDTLPEYLKGSLGILHLAGSEKLFAIDGQHRVVGIREAVAQKSGLGDEEVPAIFVAHDRDAAGLERTRRLFTTLNRYAKPVSKKERIALDEDDVVAILTRELVEEHPLFRDKVSLAKGKNISATDSRSLTTIVALYDALDLYLREPTTSWRQAKTLRPGDKAIQEYLEKAQDLWSALTERFRPLREVEESAAEDLVAGRYRSREGGHLLFRPIGLGMVVNVVRQLRDGGVGLRAAVKRVSAVPMMLAEEPWAGLLWDTKNRRMITAQENQKAALRVLWYGVGGRLEDLKGMKKMTRQDLIAELGGLLNREPEQVRLRRYVSSERTSHR